MFFADCGRNGFLLLLILFLTAPAWGAEDPAEMETVTVTGQAEPALTGSNTLSRETLDHLPMRNGSINEAIGILPGVQLGEYSRTSDNAGEILPPNLSISGGRFYENNFILDGMGNNSLLDPANEDNSNISNVPGHPQELFVNPHFVKTINVYRFNVPARFGSFTGGVVDVETDDPSGTFGGEVYLRHTRDEWTELHYDASREGEFDNPRSGEVQPKFDKYDGGISLDIPLNEHNGILLGYSQFHSKIPLLLIDQTENQYRNLENYFLKYVGKVGSDTTVRVTGIGTPYEADYFLTDTLGSNYTNENSAYGVTGTLEYQTGWGNVEVDLGYRNSESTREALPNYFIWRSRLGTNGPLTSKSWGAAIGSPYSKEGGYGDFEKELSTFSTELHITGEPLQTGPLLHRLAAGFSYEEAEASFRRPQEMTRYLNAATNSSVVCEPGAIDCIPGEQFMIYKNTYPVDNAGTRIRFYDTYLENTLTWGRLTLRPGLRFSYDDLQHNDNWAPRLAASYDLFGDGNTILVGGLNRYYGKTLLTHALDEGKAPVYTQTRPSTLNMDKTTKPWTTPKASTAFTRLADLETPYADEWVVGIEQALIGGILRIDYLERNSEDELAGTSIVEGVAPNTTTYSQWTNEGSSQHQEASLSWERRWQDHYLLLNATWQETETSNSNYLQRADTPDFDRDGAVDPVWYNGHTIDRADLPRPDFNREWIASLTYTGRLPWGFTFTNVTRYRSGYTALDNTGTDYIVRDSEGNPTGESLDIYDEIKQPESWVFDWIIEWQKNTWEGQSLTVSLEINNVFDEKVTSGESIDVYDLGRQIWLGMTYQF